MVYMDMDIRAPMSAARRGKLIKNIYIRTQDVCSLWKHHNI
jgi:hypothetical protein